MFTTLNIAYFHKYHMLYDLIASFIQREMKVRHLQLHHHPDPVSLLNAIKGKSIDLVIINSASIFDGFFRETEIRKMLSALSKNKHITTIFFAQNLKPMFLKKISETGVSIMLSAHDSPHELIAALMNKLKFARPEPYISSTLETQLQQVNDKLTAKEWEVLNLINQGYSLSEIASKKCRAMSTVSTQKHKAMNKLNLTNENELLRFLQQNAFFNY